jgi:hypothetical protein
MTREPANGKLQHPSRRTIKPLDIVDRNQQRRYGGKRAEHGHGGRGDRPLTGGCIAGTGPEERNLERATLRRRERRQHVRLDADQQICESRVRKRRLHLCRCAPQHANRGRPRPSDALTPKRRLANAGLTFEHAGSRPLLQGFQEAAQTLLLAVSAENDAAHAPRLGTRTVFRKSAGL